MVLTKNEKKVLRFLALSREETSINGIAKTSNLSPGGAYKILSKFAKEGVLAVKSIANLKSYSLNFTSEKTESILKLAFLSEALEGRILLRAEDLQPLRKITLSCILFGSYITSKKTPGDLDLFCILEKRNFPSYKHTLAQVQERVPLKIQDVVQTPEDLRQNLIKKDPIIHAALWQGVVLWGADTLIGVIKNVHGGERNL